jgi:hypothetical protein
MSSSSLETSIVCSTPKDSSSDSLNSDDGSEYSTSVS